MSHVRALAVKTSPDEVSADAVLLLDRWPPEKREDKPRCHNRMRARSQLRAAAASSSALQETPSGGRGWQRSLHTWRRRQQPYVTVPPKMEISNLSAIPLTFSGNFYFPNLFSFFLKWSFTAWAASRWLKWQQSGSGLMNCSNKR